MKLLWYSVAFVAGVVAGVYLNDRQVLTPLKLRLLYAGCHRRVVRVCSKQTT